MNTDILLQHFDRISEAPGAVGRLRRFILDLAVRGKLVEQDHNDESATELLKRIQAEKARRINTGEMRNPRALEFYDDKTPLFSLPLSWQWVCLAEVGSIVGGGTPPSGDLDNFTTGGTGIAWLTPADLGKHDGLFVSHGSRDLTEKGLKESSATIMPKGSVLFTSRAPIGYTAISLNDISTNQGFKSVVPYIAECARYIAVYLQAFRPWIDAKASGTTFREVSGKIVAGLPFPLPPIAEQHRIIAKVDELMALCDKLEMGKNEREVRRDRLVTASLHQLNTSSEIAEAAQFHLSLLPRLTTRRAHITQLRHTIFNLAVRGKLVSQDTEDKPVEDFLKNIHAEKALLVKDKKIPRQKSSTGTPQLKFELPPKWSAIHFDDVCSLITSGSRGWGEHYATSGPKFIRAQNIRFGQLRLADLACVNPPPNSEGMRTQIQEGDILIVITGAGVTNPAVMDRDLGEAYVSQHVALIKPIKKALSPWLLLCLMAGPGGRNELVERAYGAGKPGLNLDNIRTLSLPIPPLTEQRRILNKVIGLMTLCDQLEAQIAITERNSHSLLEAVLHDTLTTPIQEEAAPRFATK
jgi:type I restriction enzyme S subunit